MQFENLKIKNLFDVNVVEQQECMVVCLNRACTVYTSHNVANNFLRLHVRLRPESADKAISIVQLYSKAYQITPCMYSPPHTSTSMIS